MSSVPPRPSATPDRRGKLALVEDGPVPQARVRLEGHHQGSHGPWIVLRTVRDLLRGFLALHFVGPCATVFGSARIPEEHPSYALARRLGRELGRLGFTVMTGGGPGLMEAANRGAREVGARSVGCNIELPTEQQPNPYLDRLVTCRYFFARKVLLFKYSYAFVALPGGFGTMDELFEALTLMQTRKMVELPVVLMGTVYWRPLLRQLVQMISADTLEADEMKTLLVTDDPDEAIAHIRLHAIEQFGLRARPTSRRPRWLGGHGRRSRPAGR
jgi:uncharacterized protein (TIGR00730 family)